MAPVKKKRGNVDMAVDDLNHDENSDGEASGGCLEFSMQLEKVEQVSSLKDRLKDLYGVTITKGMQCKESDGNERQWYSLVGPIENCRQAKAYILASCDPGEAMIFEFDPKLYELLSNESKKLEIEKMSNTLLLFDESNSGSVIIQGDNDLSVGIAMSLLEAAAYEASFILRSPNKLSKTELRADQISGQGNTKQKLADTGFEMESAAGILQLSSGALMTSDPLNSPDQEMQRLVKSGREKGYTDDEIRDVLAKKGTASVPKASDFFRTLHTNRNLRKNSESEPGRSTNSLISIDNDVIVSLPSLTSKDDFKLDFDSIVKKVNQKEGEEQDTTWSSSACNKDLNRSMKVSLTSFKSADEGQGKAQMNQLVDHQKTRQMVVSGMGSSSDKSLTAVEKSHPADNTSSKPDLLKIEDPEEREKQIEINQRRYRERFLEPSALRSENAVDTKVSELDEFSLPRNLCVSNLADEDCVVISSPERNDNFILSSPNKKQRKKKKKQEKEEPVVVVDLTGSNNNCRSRSPIKVQDQTEMKVWQPMKDHGLNASTKIKADRLNDGRKVMGSSSSSSSSGSEANMMTTTNQNLSSRSSSSSSSSRNVVPKESLSSSRAPFSHMSTPMAAYQQNLAPGAFQPPRNLRYRLRYIVIDGSNVAMAHGNGKFFSCQGIRIVVQHFRDRGHEEITVFVPQWRRQTPSYDNPNPIRDQKILEDLKDEGVMNFTPSKRIPGKKNITCYDDRFILRLAQDTNGIIVSNDNYRDLYLEKSEWTFIIENRVLPFTFVGDRFMLPDDPLGRDGPTLDNFLQLIDPMPNRSFNPMPTRTQTLVPGQYSNWLHSPAVQPNESSSIRLQQQQNSVRTVASNQNLMAPGVNQNHRQWGSSSYLLPVAPGEQWTNKIDQAIFPPPTAMHRWPFRSSAPFVNAPVPRATSGPSLRTGLHMPPNAAQAARNFMPPRLAESQRLRQQQPIEAKTNDKQRSAEETRVIQEKLLEIFPSSEQQIKDLLLKDKCIRDLFDLSNILLQENEGN